MKTHLLAISLGFMSQTLFSIEKTGVWGAPQQDGFAALNERK